MATRVLTDCKLWLAGYDLSGDMNALGLTYAAEMVDDTVFGDDTRSNKGGLKTLQASHQGLWQAGTAGVDTVLWDRVGTANVPMSIAPTTGAAGEVAYTFRCSVADYQPGGAVGDMLAFSVTAEADGGEPLVKGTVIHNATQTATGTGTGYEVGAVAAGEALYGALHVISASGTSPTLDVVVQSDDANTFATATTRLTFDQQTAIGSDWQTAAGAITDTWYRVSFTIGGTSPSFEFVVVLGVV